MIISGIRPLSLIDYPNHLAATIFIGGCNFRCPFCYNCQLVVEPKTYNTINNTIDFLKTRTRFLEGVCITGGEPTLDGEKLLQLIFGIRKIGLKVKLDTNGTDPLLLETLVEQKLVNYIAMDIKSSKENYLLAIGVKEFDLSLIFKSAEILLQNKVDYEFRTTCSRTLITKQDIESIGEWLKDAEQYYLQSFLDTGKNIQKGLQRFSNEEMEELATILRQYIKKVETRGI